MAFNIKNCAAAPEGILVWLKWGANDDPNSLSVSDFKVDRNGTNESLARWRLRFDGRDRIELLPGSNPAFRPAPGDRLTIRLRKRKCECTVLPADSLTGVIDPSTSIAKNTARIAGADEFLVGYPLMTTEAEGGVGTGGAATGSGARALIDRNIKAILRNVPRDDNPERLEISLKRAIDRIEEDGTVRYVIRRHLAGAPADAGGGEGLAGAQASLVAFADAAMAASLPLLDNLRSLDVKYDPELTEADLAILRTSWTEFVNELHRDGGPRNHRTDALANDLDGKDRSGNEGANRDAKKNLTSYVDQVGGRLGMLEVDANQNVIVPIQIKRTRLNVVTADEEQALTDFLALRNLIRAATDSWRQQRTEVYEKLPLGLGQVHVERALGVVAQSVQETEAALDSVFFDEDQRRSVRVGRTDDAMSVEDLLEWVSSYATEEGPQLVHEAGSRGIEAVGHTAEDLQQEVQAFRRFINRSADGRYPALRHPRVGNALAEIESGLRTVVEAALD
jgi:hypothetical protein